MKILYILPFMRIPPDFGMGIRDYHILRYLAERHQVVLASFETDGQGDLIAWARSHLSDFVSVGQIISPKESNRFKTLQRLVDYPPSTFARFRPYQLAAQIQSILDRHPDIDIFVFETLLTAQSLMHLRSRRLPPCVAVLLDDPGQYARRRRDVIGLRPYKLIYFAEWLSMALYERRILSHYDYLITVSPGDAERLRRITRARIFVSPNGVDTAFFTPVGRRSHNPHALLFVGSFSYPPNVDAFFYMYESILPGIWARMPDVRFLAVGLYPTPEMCQISRDDPRVVVTGQVPDVRPYYAQADIAVVPLRLGSGIKLKVLEAMSMGVPVVTTRVGSEGIDAREGEHMLVADRPEDFAQAILELLGSNGSNAMLTAKARALAENYDWMNIARELEVNLVRIARKNPA